MCTKIDIFAQESNGCTMEILRQFSVVPITNAVLKSVLTGYKSVNTKIHALEKEGSLIRLKKGLYVVSPKISGAVLSPELIANHLYGPSYVSMESALRYYGLIPERVFAVRSMTTKHNRTFENEIGTFFYREVPDEYFAIGITQSKTAAPFLIATPEKALCDLIAYTAGLSLRSVKTMGTYLMDYLRFDMEALRQFDTAIIRTCAETGKKRMELQNLIKLIER